MPNRRTFSATPTTSAHGALSAPIFMHLPIAPPFGHHMRAAVSLTMTTGALPARSSSLNERPARMRVPIVLKNWLDTALVYGPPWRVIGTVAGAGRLIIVSLDVQEGMDCSRA